jgi:dTDP-4-dehydrorhamnose reductase
MRKLGAERDELRVVTDQVGCPTYARDLAAALLILVGLDQYGTLHFCNTGICSWNAFAVEILRLAGSHCRVLPQRSTDLQRPAPRPAYSALNTESFTQATGLLPRSWQASLRECMNHLKGKD